MFAPCAVLVSRTTETDLTVISPGLHGGVLSDLEEA